MLLLFSTGTLQGTNVPLASRVSSNCATHHGFPEESRRWLRLLHCIGAVVWSFMFRFCWTCRCIQRHVPCKFWKVCLGLGIFHRSIMGEIDLLGCRPAHRLSLICLLIELCSFCIVGIPAAVIWMLLWDPWIRFWKFWKF